MSKEEIKIENKVDYKDVKCLLMASYLLGQEAGLAGMRYAHPEAVAERKEIISLLSNL